MDLYNVSQFLGFAGQNILQHLRISGEEFRAVQPGLAVVIDGAVIHICLHHVLEHVAAIGQFRVVSCLIIGNFADGVELADFRVSYRDTQFR